MTMKRLSRRRRKRTAQARRKAADLASPANHGLKPGMPEIQQTAINTFLRIDKPNGKMNKLNRRDFFKGTLAAGAASAVMGPRSAHAEPSLSETPAVEPLRISILSYAFHGLLREQRMNVFGYLESCKYRYGLNAADVWNGFFPSTDEDFIAKVKDAIVQRELVLADLCCDQCHVWDDDEEVRANNYENAKRHLEIADTLGARFVRIDAGSRSETWNDEMFDHIVMRFKEYAQFAHDNGFKVGAENHWGPEKKWSEMKRLIEAVDHPGLGLSCHLGSWEGDEEANRIADKEAAPYVSHTHIDWRRCTGPELHEKLANLWDIGYEGYYSVEHHTGQNEYKEVAIQLAIVRHKLKEFRDHGTQAEGREIGKLPIWRSSPNAGM